MPFDVKRARTLLQACDLPKLFVEELGWEPRHDTLSLRVGNGDYSFSALAVKHGFVAWLCEAPDGSLPDRTTRLKLDRKLSETSFEHLIVFVSSDRVRQSWVWVRRETGTAIAMRTHEYQSSQPGDSLLQKLRLLYISLEEEEAGTLTTVGVASRARAAFDIDRVTKTFFRDFDALRKAFVHLIDGIAELPEREWYASVMLNRLMFVYFIQRKGFLDGDPHYLRNRLDRCKKEWGNDKFYSFYRFFLLRLFHEGLGKRRENRSSELAALLGTIPYLNGGLFDVHELEKPERYGKHIQIPDKAFEAIFEYFDRWQWHLDERPLRADSEINPDVLGYIFEKYINQKQMGAYYTKEDITEYIGKNTILPYLFDAARSTCGVSFDNPDGPTVWDLLRENPDRYIYSAVRYGMSRKLPTDVAAGLDISKPDLIERRREWNKAAPPDLALPTEIWREVVARRQRCEEIRKKLAAGEVRDINDFIILNLDIRRFAQDAIQNCEGPDLLLAFWQAISTITILDPTGGSGAFLFAALTILDPLYEACLDRMEGFISEWGEAGKKLHLNYHRTFSEILARVDTHPNRRYFVLKSIILNNLYAVDIMEEAVEICKLRLFLKLAAQVEPDNSRDNLGIEPLPDIDFNIRAGNSLVGYATFNEVKTAVSSGLDFDGAMDKIAAKAAELQHYFNRFRILQAEGTVPATEKAQLQKFLKALEEELNRHLASDYGVKASNRVEYAAWLKSHQPFHWFVEFYGILKAGGFDVIMGNPPYLDLKQLESYEPRNYATIVTKNLYSMIIERCGYLSKGRQGYIVPISSTATEGYAELQKILIKRQLWFTSFDDRPAHLFDGLDKNTLSILLLSQRTEKPEVFSSRLNRWSTEERDSLFAKLRYFTTPSCLLPGCFPRVSTSVESGIWAKLFDRSEKMVSAFSEIGRATTYYSRKVNSFLQVLDFVPQVKDGHGKLRPPSEFKEMTFSLASHAAAALCVFNSSLFRWFMDIVSDGSHLNRRETDLFPFDPRNAADALSVFVKLGKKLSSDLKQHSFERKMTYSHGTLTVQCIVPKFSKFLLDEIDKVLAEYYGFTEEELDFIINYDIKYRLGRDIGDEEE